MRMEVDAKYAIGSGAFDEVGHEFRANRNPGLILAILSRVARVRKDTRNARGRGASGCVNQQQQLQHVLSGRVCGLHHKDVGTADVFVDANKNFSVRKSR